MVEGMDRFKEPIELSESGRFEIWETPGGRMGSRYSVKDLELGLVVKKGLSSIDEAYDYIDSEEMEAGDEAIEILKLYINKSGPTKTLKEVLERKSSEERIRGGTSKYEPSRFQPKELTIPEALSLVDEIEKGKRKYREIGETAYGGWTYLGGGKRHGVWQSPAKRYQLAHRVGEGSYISGLDFVPAKRTEQGEIIPESGKLVDVIQKLPREEIEFQIPMSGMPKVEGQGRKLGREFTMRELPSDQIVGIPEGYSMRREY